MAGLDVIPRVDGLHWGACVRPRSAWASTFPLATSIAVSKPLQSPTYNVRPSTDGADAIGPWREVVHARVNCGTVATPSDVEPAGVPLIDGFPQYFGQPAASAGATRRTLGLENDSVAVSSSNAMPPMTCFMLQLGRLALENVD